MRTTSTRTPENEWARGALTPRARSLDLDDYAFNCARLVAVRRAREQAVVVVVQNRRDAGDVDVRVPRAAPPPAKYAAAVLSAV